MIDRYITMYILTNTSLNAIHHIKSQLPWILIIKISHYLEICYTSHLREKKMKQEGNFMLAA